GSRRADRRAARRPLAEGRGGGPAHRSRGAREGQEARWPISHLSRLRSHGTNRDSFIIPAARIGTRTAIHNHRTVAYRIGGGEGFEARRFQPRPGMTAREEGAPMRCPNFGSLATQVKDSRPTQGFSLLPPPPGGLSCH